MDMNMNLNFKTALITNCKELIEEHYIRTSSFQRWIIQNAEIEINAQYQETFDELSTLSNDSETILWVLSKNLVFSIRAFLEYKNDATCDELQYFVERFLENQLGDEKIWQFFKLLH
jgi:pectate lyase